MARADPDQPQIGFKRSIVGRDQEHRALRLDIERLNAIFAAGRLDLGKVAVEHADPEVEDGKDPLGDIGERRERLVFVGITFNLEQRLCDCPQAGFEGDVLISIDKARFDRGHDDQFADSIDALGCDLACHCCPLVATERYARPALAQAGMMGPCDQRRSGGGAKWHTWLRAQQATKNPAEAGFLSGCGGRI